MNSHKNYIIYFFLTVYFIFVHFIFSAQAQYAPSFYRIQHFGTEDGLSQNFVECMYQDSRGFIWAGTQDGLNMFDGYKFTVFRVDSKNDNSISNSFIYDILEDNQHNMWFATRGGLNKYNFDTNNFETFHAASDSIPEDYVLDLFFDSKKRLWIGTQNQGVAFCDISTGKPRNFVRFNMDNANFESNKINNVYEDKKGFIWISTQRGAYRYNPSSQAVESLAKLTKHIDKFVSLDFSAVYQDVKGLFWFATQLGLYKWDPETDQLNVYGFTIGEKTGLKSDVFLDIQEDNFNNVLIASYYSLASYNRDSDKFSVFSIGKDDYSINNEFVNCILIDREGVVWIGTEKGGLNKYNNYQKKFRSIIAGENGVGMNASIVNAISETEDKLLIGTVGGGLNVYDRNTKTFSYYKHDPKNPKSISWDVISFILNDGNGRIWTASWGGGISMTQINNFGEFRHFRHNGNDEHTLSDDRISSLYYLEKQKLLLVGTFLGFTIIDTEDYSVHRFKGSANGVKPISVSALRYDSKDRLWIGTTEGLFMLQLNANSTRDDIIDGKGLVRYTHNEKDSSSLGSNFITTIVEDSDNQLWFAVHGSGLDKFLSAEKNHLEVKNYSLADGLCNGVVYAIAEDKNKQLWLSTDNGLSHFDKHTEVFTNYFTFDGLRSNQFYWTANLRDQQGQIYFGSLEGICVFDPDEIKNVEIQPKLAFTDFKMFNKSVVPSADNKWLKAHINSSPEIVLEYSDNVISFEFTALSYILPERNRYAYKMENFESEWNYTDSERRFASYTNLNPGTYTFRVKAANATGVWNEEGISIKIVVKPPFWLTWWFITLSLAFIIGSVVGYYRYRMLRLKRQKAELELKVKERTSELSLANADLLEKQEEIMQQQEEILSQRDELSKRNEELADTNAQINSQNIQINEQKENLQKALSDIELLSDFGKRITAELDIEELESIIYEYVGKLMDTTAFGIGRFNPKRNKLEFQHFIERGKIIPFFDKDIDDPISLAIRCFKNREVLLKNNSDKAYHEYLKTLPEMKERLIPHSAVHVPLVIDKRTIGIVVVNSERENAYTETDIINLQSLASYIAVALDNAAAYRMLNTKSEAINGSIRYGLNIQKAILPPASQFDSFEHFVLFKPKDIVSGDFYWAQSYALPEGEVQLVAAVDCTGHGVPGAFMSLIGSRLLDEIVIQEGVVDPSQILTRLDKKVQSALNQEETGNNDGMDVCICAFHKNNMGEISKITYAGAKRPLLIYRSHSANVEIIPADRYYIGRSKNKHIEKTFTTQTVRYKTGDVLYLSSDGLIDQNSPDRSKFGTQRLLSTLTKLGSKPLDVQREELDNEIKDFMQLQEQRDDITIVGLKLKVYSNSDPS